MYFRKDVPIKKIFLAAVFGIIPGLSHAATLGDFSKVVYFGDSFTDGGAAFALAGPAAVPPAIYPNGQLTNGDVWATQLGGTFANGTNFAVGGAEAIAEADDISPDLAEQIGWFLGSGLDLGSNALAAILIGGNDLGEASNLAEVSAIGTGVVNEIVLGAQTLLSNGIAKVAVLGMPDLGIFPSVVEDGLDAIASAYTPVFNTELQLALAANFAPDEAVYFDTYSVFDAILSDPGALGITDTTSACLDTPLVCLAGDPNSFFFYDAVHPTEVVHTELARAFRAEFGATAVPLPAGFVLILTGLGGLVLQRRLS